MNGKYGPKFVLLTIWKLGGQATGGMLGAIAITAHGSPLGHANPIAGAKEARRQQMPAGARLQFRESMDEAQKVPYKTEELLKGWGIPVKYPRLC
ncbi:hypothetical protein LZ554_005578 [Drepanopeziza brunnea f. sp. 'monogermtubi']|nr:hypothetical protein LZ554_005578 [Drepanopeziza brunnea f. sp. 'monogermtubi']